MVISAILITGIFLICLVYYYDISRQDDDNVIDIKSDKIRMDLSDKLIKLGDNTNLLSDIRVKRDKKYNYTIEVDSSGLNVYKEGQYNVVYTVTAADKKESKVRKITVRRDKSDKSIANKENQSFDDIYKDKIESSDIQLSNGNTAHIECYKNRYILKTATETEEIERYGKKVQINNLKIYFSNGEFMIIESIEKNID